jgi:hypothetical protein
MEEAHNFQRSIFRVISKGIVSENKKLNSPLIEAHPIELFNLMDGELSSDLRNDEYTGLNEDGTMYKESIKVGATVEAVWLGETNRVTPPDVRRGEQVKIWQSGDSDQYFWTSLGRDDDLRRLETVIYRFSGFPDIEDEEMDIDNSYTFEVSTHRGVISIRTSKRNGEFTRYLFQFNTKDGNVTLKDDLGNIFQMDSARTNILIENADKSIVELNKKQIFIKSLDQIQLLTRDLIARCETLSVHVGGDTELLVKGWTNIHTKGKFLIKSDTSLVLTGPKNTITL